MLSPASRYYGIPTASFERSSDRTVIYLRRRFLPQPDRFVLIQEHVVALGDRLDNIAAHYLDDAEQFWRIADANSAMNPSDLVEPVGRRLRITLPEGMPGTPDA